MSTAPWTEQEIAAQRDILIDWHNLSAGDVSVIKLITTTHKDANIVTMSETHHARFWFNLVALKWAESVPPALDDSALKSALKADVLSFRLTDLGKKEVARFIEFRKLFDMADYNHKVPRRLEDMQRYILNS